MATHPAFEPLQPALTGRYLGLLSQGIPAEIAAADMLGTLQDASYELPASDRPGMTDIVDTVKAAIQAARHRQHTAAMS